MVDLRVISRQECADRLLSRLRARENRRNLRRTVRSPQKKNPGKNRPASEELCTNSVVWGDGWRFVVGEIKQSKDRDRRGGVPCVIPPRYL